MSETYSVPFRYQLSRPVIKGVFRLVFHILGKVKVIGKENIPYGKPYVVAMNHISIFDPPLIGAFWPEHLDIVGASDVFEKPGRLWWLQSSKQALCPTVGGIIRNWRLTN